MKKKKIADFQAFEPIVKPMGRASGGGFRLQVEIPETEFEKIKELNDPRLKNNILRVKIFIQD